MVVPQTLPDSLEVCAKKSVISVGTHLPFRSLCSKALSVLLFYLQSTGIMIARAQSNGEEVDDTPFVTPY